MMWLPAALGALVLILLAVAFVSYVELSMFLAPRSFWWRIVPRGNQAPAPSGPAEEQESRNESRLRAEAAGWADATEHESVFLQSGDGLSLHAVQYAQKQGRGLWAICVHGYTGDSSTMACYGKHYFERGFNVLLPDNRAHGSSGGKHIGMGWLDKDDLVLWVSRILHDDPEARIVLHGESMGAATVMMASGCGLPDSVRCIVSDCGYTSVWNQFRHVRKKDMHLTAFPILYASDIVNRFVAGYTLTGASSVRQLAKSRTPTLFVHGEDDTFVPAYMLRENYEACAAPKEMRLFPHAGHCQSEFYDPAAYWQAVDAFVDVYVQ